MLADYENDKKGPHITPVSKKVKKSKTFAAEPASSILQQSHKNIRYVNSSGSTKKETGTV